ncbi:MAG: hypothetical protein KAH32_06350 [Chlamydiia bacterium]|nr:hypothetical protein [Chlamydiia bacterium]
MKLPGRNKYNPLDFKKLPYLKQVEERVFNGNFDVTDAADNLVGIKTGEEDIRLLDYLVYRPLPKALVDFYKMPDVHPKSYDMQLYYKKIWEGVKEGITVGKEYFNPFFMIWVTVFIFEIPVVDKKGNLLPDDFIIGKPIYSTIDRYILDNAWKAKTTKKYIALMSGRGIGKSFITVAISLYYYIFGDNKKIIISGTSEDITSEAWTKVRETIGLIEKEYPEFAQKRRSDSLKKIEAVEEYYDIHGTVRERGSMNTISKIVYGDDANSTRGRRPDFQHIEEFAAFPSHPAKGSLKNVIGQSKGSWKVGGSVLKAFVFYTGTGGSVNNADAEDIVMNPRAFNILPVKEWAKQGGENSETGLFIPSQLKYSGTWEANGTPNVALATKLMLETRKEIESDAVAYIQELQEFPMILEEVFLRKGINDFNQDKVAEQIINLKNTKEKPWEEGRLDYIMERGQPVGVKFVPQRGGNVFIIEKPQKSPDNKPIKNLYVGGVDGIDQGKNDSLIEGSKLAVAVKKRIPGSIFAGTSNLYVAFYNHRSDDVRTDYDVTLKLSIYYNAQMNVEYTKLGVVGYFRERKEMSRLMKRPSIAIGSKVKSRKASMLIGTPAVTAVIDHQDEKLATYIEDYYNQIMYLPALIEIKEYDRKNRTRFDLVIAMGLAELADEDLLDRPPTIDQGVSSDLTDFGFYKDPQTGKKRWGEIPTNIISKEFKPMTEDDLPHTEFFDWTEA